MTQLAAEPRWPDAAQALVAGLVDLPDEEDRVMLLGRVCDGLGDALYPAFLQLLWTVRRHGDHAACAAVARALVHALATGRLPSGRRGAWGARLGIEAPARPLGPLEYLCAWHAQAEPAHALPASRFDSAARGLMELVAACPEARALYCRKLLADAEDPLAGMLTRRTRAGLRALASAWSEGGDAAAASAGFLAAIEDGAAPGSLRTLVGPSLQR